MFLFFVRHGMPDYKNDCLTKYGEKQVVALAERFSLMGLDKIFASTMGRATKSAEYTAKKLGLDVEGVDFAREDLASVEFSVVDKSGSNVWCFNDKTTLNLFNSEEIKRLGDKWFDSPYFADTKFKSGTLRIKKFTVEFMRRLGYRFDEQHGTYSVLKHIYDKAAFFAHGGFSMIFLSCLLDIPYPLFCTRFEPTCTSGVSVIHIENDGEGLSPRIMQYGNDSHLFKYGLLDAVDRRTW